MISLALIGRDIQHSMSPKIYKEFLGDTLNYVLLDVQNTFKLELKSLFKEYKGISITAPYKRDFLDQVSVDSDVQKLQAINCMRLNGGVLEGTNTDYWAVKKQIEKFQKKYSKIFYIILGDGAMSFMTTMILNELDLQYKVLSRKLKNLNEKTHLYHDTKTDGLASQVIVINTCSRHFVFRGEISSHYIFWDYNYNFEKHENLIPKKCEYLNGMDMLKEQARVALKYWGITKNN